VEGGRGTTKGEEVVGGDRKEKDDVAPQMSAGVWEFGLCTI